MTAGATRREILKFTGTTSVGAVWGTFTDGTSPFLQVTESVTINRTVGETVYLPAAPDATVAGSSTFDPDTELLVRVVSTGESPFALSNTATVADDGTWSVSFDLSDRIEGQDLTISVLWEEEELASAPGVIGTLSADLSFPDQLTRDSGTLVIVGSATLEAGGFIAIYPNADPNRVIGVSEYLEPGRNYRELPVRLEEGVVGETTLIGVAHLDTDLDQSFDYTADGSVDVPYEVGEQLVRDTAIVTGPPPTTPVNGQDRRPPYPGGDVAVAGAGGLFGVWILRKAGRQIRPDPDDDTQNRLPNAQIFYAPNEPDPGRPIIFDGSMSTDPDPGDRIVNYRWTLDGRERTAPRFVHAFLKAGEYEATLKVVDSHGGIGTQTETITVKTEEGELALTRVRPDAPGDDHENLDQEYLVFENVGEAVLDLEGWTIHDAAEEEDRVTEGEHTFAFPDGYELDPGTTVTVHTGQEPGDKANMEEGETRHVFWGKQRAVWNNDEDIIVVEDDESHPVMAIQYDRTDAGEYELQKLDVEILEEWFPEVVVSSRDEAPLLSIDLGMGIREQISSIGGFVAGAAFLQGPRKYLRSWAFITAFLLMASLTWGASTGTGLLMRSVEPIVPLLLLVGSTFMLVIGVLWLLVSAAISFLLGLLP